MIDRWYRNTENCKNKQQNWKSKEELEKEKREVIHKGFLIIKLNEIRQRARCVQLIKEYDIRDSNRASPVFALLLLWLKVLVS